MDQGLKSYSPWNECPHQMCFQIELVSQTNGSVPASDSYNTAGNGVMQH